MLAYIRMWWCRIRARNLTAASFERAYAARSGATIEELRPLWRKYGRYVKPCACGEDGCDGWQMAHAED